MRAVVVAAAFAVAANAIAIPAGETTQVIGGHGVDPEHPPTVGGLDPNARPGIGGSSPSSSGSHDGPSSSGSHDGPSSSGSHDGPSSSGSHDGPSSSGSHDGPSSSGSHDGPSSSGSHDGPSSSGSHDGPSSSGSHDGPSSSGSHDGPSSSGSHDGPSGGPHDGGHDGGSHDGGHGGDEYPKHDDDYDNYHKPDNYDQDTTYTPHYPSGGYKSPEQYPQDCVYSKPHHPPPPKDCDYGKTRGYPYPNDYPAKGDYGQRGNHGNDYKPHGYSPPKDCGVYSPRHGQPVTCGKKHKFEWHGFKGKQVKLELVYGKGGDDCHHYTTIVDRCDNTGHYEWDVPRDIPPTGGLYGYGLKVTCHDTGDVYYSPQFCFDNKDFYNEYKHPACPSEAPQPIVVPPCTECQAPPPPPAQTAAPVPAATPCPTQVAAPVATGNSTIPTYESGASGVKQSMSFIAALAALVAFAL